MTAPLLWLMVVLIAAAAAIGGSRLLRQRQRQAQREHVARRRAEDAAAWQKALDKAAAPAPPSVASVRGPDGSASGNARRSPWSER